MIESGVLPIILGVLSVAALAANIVVIRSIRKVNEDLQAGMAEGVRLAKKHSDFTDLRAELAAGLEGRSAHYEHAACTVVGAAGLHLEQVYLAARRARETELGHASLSMDDIMSLRREMQSIAKRGENDGQ